jgi:hypothetical protein
MAKGTEFESQVRTSLASEPFEVEQFPELFCYREASYLLSPGVWDFRNWELYNPKRMFLEGGSLIHTFWDDERSLYRDRYGLDAMEDILDAEAWPMFRTILGHERRWFELLYASEESPSMSVQRMVRVLREGGPPYEQYWGHEYYYAEIARHCEEQLRGIEAPPTTRPERDLTYYGQVSPPISGFEYVGGWIPTQCPLLEFEGFFNHSRKKWKMGVVDVCAATAHSVGVFGTAKIFLPVYPETLDLHKIGCQQWSDGQEVVAPFYSGDIVYVGHDAFVARPALGEFGRELSRDLLRLQQRGLEPLSLVPVKASMSALFNRWVLESRTCQLLSFMFTSPSQDVRIVPALKAQPSPTEYERAHWLAVCDRASDPRAIGVLNRWRLEAVKNDYQGGLKAEEAEAYVRALFHDSTAPRSVCGAFKWGYCWGCGAHLPAKKMASRICVNCLRRNTDLGRLVAEGSRVCSRGSPIRYPGLVWTNSRHPPLKASAATVAVEGRNIHVGGLGLEKALQLAPIERAGPTLVTIGMDGAIPFVSSGGIRVLLEAIIYRVFKEIPRTADAAVYQAVDKFLPILLEGFIEKEIYPMARWDWLKSIKNARRRKILIKAARDLEARHEELHPKRAGTFTPFGKTEELPWFGQSEGQVMTAIMEYVPRLINGPFDEDHPVVGVSTKPMLYGLKEAWNSHHWIFYASTSPEKLDEWLMELEEYSFFLMGDYTAYDSTYVDASWDLIESIYRRVLRDEHPHFWEILKRWRKPRGKTSSRKEDVSVSFQADTMNASGRDDTALANAMLNGLVISMSMAATISGKSILDLDESDIQQVTRLCRIGIVGDDSLVATNFDISAAKTAFEQHVASFGMIVKAAVTRELCEVTFLGQMPYLAAGRLVWGPTLGRRLYKWGWKTERGGNYPAWGAGVADQTALYRSVPLLSDLSLKVVALTKGQKRTAVSEDENRPWTLRTTEQSPYDTSTLIWLARRYAHVGVTVEMIRRDIKLINDIERIPCIILLESVQLMLGVDEL